MDKSTGHLCFVDYGHETREYWRRAGAIYSAPVCHVVMPDGYRSGRFVCYDKPHMRQYVRQRISAGTMVGRACKHCGIVAVEGRRQYCDGCKRERARDARRARDDAYRSCGLRKVRGALGGTYWE